MRAQLPLRISSIILFLFALAARGASPKSAPSRVAAPCNTLIPKNRARKQAARLNFHHGLLGHTAGFLTLRSASPQALEVMEAMR